MAVINLRRGRKAYSLCLFLDEETDTKTYGYIDTNGKVVIDFYPYTEVLSFSEGLAVVNAGKNVLGEGKYGYIDKTGKVVVPLEYDLLLSFNGGLSWAHQDGKWSILEMQKLKVGDIIGNVLNTDIKTYINCKTHRKQKGEISK